MIFLFSFFNFNIGDLYLVILNNDYTAFYPAKGLSKVTIWMIQQPRLQISALME